MVTPLHCTMQSTARAQPSPQPVLAQAPPTLLQHCAHLLWPGRESRVSHRAGRGWRHASRSHRQQFHTAAARSPAATSRRQPDGFQPGQMLELECHSLAFGGQVGSRWRNLANRSWIRPSIQAKTLADGRNVLLPASRVPNAGHTPLSHVDMSPMQGVCRLADGEQAPELAHLQNFVVLTRGAVPGERLLARVHKVQKGLSMITKGSSCDMKRMALLWHMA